MASTGYATSGEPYEAGMGYTSGATPYAHNAPRAAGAPYAHESKTSPDRSDSIGGMGMYNDSGNGAPLRQTYTITDEQFEKLYLGPKTAVSGDLRKTFGNPTPIAVMGFSVALLPLSISFMGWRGSGGAGVATTTASLFFGGMLLIITSVLEFFLGNTFPCVVFAGFGAHFLTLGTTFIPFYNAVNGLDPTHMGVQTAEFDASYGFYTLSMTLLSFIFLVCSIRTNVAFFLVFVGATLGFGLVTGGFFALAMGKTSLGLLLIKATGGAFFGTVVIGWYLLFSIMLAVMDLPTLPLFDLSTVVKGVSERKAAKGHMS